jgi:hypothetical protein
MIVMLKIGNIVKSVYSKQSDFLALIGLFILLSVASYFAWSVAFRNLNTTPCSSNKRPSFIEIMALSLSVAGLIAGAIALEPRKVSHKKFGAYVASCVLMTMEYMLLNFVFISFHARDYYERCEKWYSARSDSFFDFLALVFMLFAVASFILVLSFDDEEQDKKNGRCRVTDTCVDKKKMNIFCSNTS